MWLSVLIFQFLPLITMGAYPGVGAEERGQAGSDLQPVWRNFQA